MPTSRFLPRFVYVSLVTIAISGLPGFLAEAQDAADDPFGGGDSFGASDPFGSGGDPFSKPAAEGASDRPGQQAKPRSPFGGRRNATAPGSGGFGAELFAAEQPTAASQSNGVATTQQIIWADSDKANERIAAVLEEPLTRVGLDFTQRALEEVIEFLRDEYQIEIQMDVAALDELGLGPDEPVSVNLRNVSLGSALRRMLESIELTYVISNEVLLITTEEEAELHLNIAVYPVGDLLVDGDFKSLIDVLIATVATESWAENGGGEAEIRPLEPGLLVVSQTQAVHEEIVKTLTAVRKARQSPAAQAAASDEGSVKTEAYAIRSTQGEEHEKKVQQTAELLRRVVPLRPTLRKQPEKSEAQFISVIGEQLIVRATPAVHRQVRSFLSDAELSGRGGAFCGESGGLGGGGQFSAPLRAE